MLPHQRFWDCFREHERALAERPDPPEPALVALEGLIRGVHPELGFVLGPVDPRRRSFRLTAYGHRRAYPALMTLLRGAPPLPRWDFTPLLPRQETLRAEGARDVLVEPESLAFRVLRDGRRLDLEVAFAEFPPLSDDTLERLALRFLIQAVGEEVLVTQVGRVTIAEGTVNGTDRLSAADFVALCDALRAEILAED